MPKNTKGGKQTKRGKNQNEQSKREIVLKGEGEAYASVIAPMGQYQMTLRLDDMSTVTGIIRGALRKKTWIVAGDLIRVQLRNGFEDGTVDIVGKYTHNEAGELLTLGEISAGLTQGPQSLTEGGGSNKTGATAIKFVQQTGGAAAAEASKNKNQPDPNARSKNVEMIPIMRNFNKAGGMGIGGSDDENGPEDGPVGNYRPIKKQKYTNDESSSDDDEEDEEDEEGEEGEEGEEEEEEEEDEGAHAAYNYDADRGQAQNDWNNSHHHKKDQDHKQRNKRAKENQGGAGGVKAADVADI